MIFKAPVDGKYDVGMAEITMKKGDEISVPDGIEIYRVMGNSAGKSQIAGPTVSEAEYGS